ncbi:alpha/beta hydrolase [Polaribacter aestuariivivens]|uniref:Alpha/beta hydrolase n=1 Tax=Polaribacter aestuariivivens TaxID=2304626 RepID=A0A5S3N4Y7_9FLAO|nr:alpha/beta hydrolase-fold protein [Polaribacter aestuariivivens]TMM30398.1 alpha/beta hydrolase [Polaribacter aestuariivivens]
MKTYILIFICIFLIVISCKKKAEIKKEFQPKVEEKKSTKAANVSILEKEFVIKGLNDISHKVWLYLPPNYNETTEHYDVIYMHDAQNLFDEKTSFVGEWAVDETLNNLYKKTGKSFIVVGVENGGEKRIEEYTPWKHEKYGGGKGAIYIDFLANTLKPYIDANYRTKPAAENTAIIGSSLGGLISFYGGLKKPAVFGKIGALSTSFWFSDKVNDFAKANGNRKNTKIYFLVGEKEGDTMIPDTENMAKLLVDLGFPEKNIHTKIVPEGKHTESFWKAEFLETITFLFNL